jgi:hypothetical protein
MARVLVELGQLGGRGTGWRRSTLDDLRPSLPGFDEPDDEWPN